MNLAALTGANRDYILNHIPHISRIMRPSIDEVLEHAEVVVIGNGAPEFRDVPARVRPAVRGGRPRARGQTAAAAAGEYDGICW